MLNIIRRLLYKIYERFYEWRFGISSDKEILLSEFGVIDPACYHYNPTGYVRFRKLMKLITIRPGEDVFLDFGSGLGRVVVLAATYPFRQVIGVELVPEIHAIAQKNIQYALPKLRCRNIELHNMDARKFQIPPDVTVIYFWNPFSEEILADVFTNIRQSILAAPRTVTIVYLSPPGITCLDKLQPNLPWLKERDRVNQGGTSLSATIYTCDVET